MKFRQAIWITLACILAGMLIFGGWFVWVLNSKPAPGTVPFEISKATTYITEPILPDGRVDYIAAAREMHPKFVPADENSVAGLVEVMGFESRLESNSGPAVAAWVAELKLPPAKSDAKHLQTLSEYIDAAVEDREQRDALSLAATIWTHSKFLPPLEESLHSIGNAWLREQQPQFERLYAVLKRPRFYLPINELNLGGWLGEVNLHLFAPAQKSLEAHGLLSLQSSNFAALERDIDAMFALAQTIEQGTDLVALLIGIKIRESAHRLLARWITSGKMDAQAAHKWREKLQTLPTGEPLADVLEIHDRCVVLHFIQNNALAPDKWLDELGYLPYWKKTLIRFRLRFVDWTEVMLVFNESYDRAVAGLRKPTLHERLQAIKGLRVWFEDYYKPGSGPQDIPKPLQGKPHRSAITRQVIGIIFPAFSAFPMVECRRAAICQTQIVALALLEFRAERGAYPDTLAELSPGYLTAIPLDPYFEDPLSYRTEGDKFAIYSIGLNQKDDGGKRDPTDETDDVGYGHLFVETESP